MVALVGLVFLVIVGAAFADKVEDEFNFATGLFIEGDYELAAGEYEKFLKAHPDHALAARAQFQWGESLMRLEQYAKAVAPLSAYVARKTTDPDRLAAALFRLGKAHAELGKPAEVSKIGVADLRLADVERAEFFDPSKMPQGRPGHRGAARQVEVAKLDQPGERGDSRVGDALDVAELEVLKPGQVFQAPEPGVGDACVG